MLNVTQASVADHSVEPPQFTESDGSPTWVTRGSNFVIAITRASAGLRLASYDVPDEHMVLLPEIGATLWSGTGPGMRSEVARGGCHLAIMPPGDSGIEVASSGLVVRCFSRRHQAMLLLAGNPEWSRDDVVPSEDWPPPVGGFQLRLYDVGRDFTPGDKNRCYRSSNMMINVLRERREPRSLAELSPHAHEDFEQGSIALSGNFVHHLRTPWGSDAAQWLPDRALEVGSPSVTVIAPKVIHTTRNHGPAPALLADLFCPPRVDFSLRSDMVRNGGDYPLPATKR